MTRPDVLQGETPCIKTKCGDFFITVNVNDEGRPVEMQLKLGKAGNCPRAWDQFVGEMLSDFLKTSKVERIWKHAYGIDCVKGGLQDGVSCQNAIAQVLEKYVTDKEFVKTVKDKVALRRANEAKSIPEDADGN